MAREAARQVPELIDVLDDDALAQALTCVALSLPYAEDPAEALPLCASLWPRGARSIRLQARIDQAQGTALLWLGRPREGWPVLRAALDRIAGGSAQAEAVNLGNQLLRASELMGLAARAAAEAEDTRRLVHDVGLGPLYEADLLHHGGLLQLVAGQPGPGLRAMAAADALLGSGAQHGFYYAMRSAIALRLLGAPDEARAQLLALEPPSGALVARAFWCALRARLAANAGEPWQSWLDEAVRCCACPDGMLALRLQVLALALAPQRPVGATAALLAELDARGMQGLLRQALGAAARGALVAGDQRAAIAHAQAALALADRTDPWLDDPATVWLEAGSVLREAGEPAAAAAALATGAQWVKQAANTLDEPATRRRWCEANAVHRALLAGA